jgi:hypothetical protein
MKFRKVAVVHLHKTGCHSSVISYFILRVVIVDENEPGAIYILGELVYWFNLNGVSPDY